MSAPRLRTTALTVVTVALALAPAGCGILGGSRDGADGDKPVDDAPEKSRARVQSYLDAMVAKDLNAGREQLCAPMREAFDRFATGSNGDFADHFTVPEATITDVRASGGNQEVSTSITVLAEGKSSGRGVLFTVAKSDGGWCIVGERAGGNTPPVTTSAPPSP